MYNVKAVAVGDGSVGKTSMLQTFINGSFEEEYAPTVFDKHDVTIKVEGKDVCLALLDTAGQEGFDRLRPLSYVESDVFIICFALNDEDSFANIKFKWIPELKHHEPDTPYIIVGTKNDVRKERNDVKDVLYYQGEAKKLGAYTYMECSAKENKNLPDVFNAAAKAALNHLDLIEEERTPGGSGGGGGCCTIH